MRQAAALLLVSCARLPVPGGGGEAPSWDLRARQVVESRLPILQDCWETELRRVEDLAAAGTWLDGGTVPPLAGTLVLVLPVQADGRVAGVRIDEDRLGNERVAACLVSEARLIRFPSVPGGEPVELRVPFSFKVTALQGPK